MAAVYLGRQSFAIPKESVLDSSPSLSGRGADAAATSDPVKAHVGSCQILIADDHPIFRYGLRTLLEAEPGFSIAGEAVDGKQAVELAARLMPDILLLDLAMPRYSGLHALRHLANTCSPVRTLILAAAIERDDIVEALQLGARGIVSKESASEVLIESIHTILAGHYWVGRESISGLVQALREGLPRPGERVRDKNFGLTAREIEIITAVVAAYTNKDIAYKFSISEQTVKHHLTSIFDKLGVSNRLELALLAVNHHLIMD